ncbi:GNAT family N-acetyltransferase [Flavobacteriaceae bacterium F89]|uniref:GNAT family N-acetyltransferase n=1 Tax=Cerina litoralis TaxID=2874477 RepID=A0AAE3EU32_9FLAO|nr:GNAT family N-acetyltransferase [Cerina litoralis]MCG2461097.1 GNAT family N-acetyltransferase [Cerina litoralis]
MDSAIIREIRPEDNAEVAQLIRNVLVELGVPKVGTAFADKALGMLYETYNVQNAAFYVLVNQEKLLGCGGIGPLEHQGEPICELQKMYFLPEARGKGWGSDLMRVCLNKAKDYGYKHCYLETMPNMIEAQKLYKKWGFEHIDMRMGNTGHFSCPVWMLKRIW